MNQTHGQTTSATAYNARTRPRAGDLRARRGFARCEFPRACELAPAHARKRTMCPRPARRPDTYFLRIGREGAHGSESRAEGRVSRSRSRVLRRVLRRSAVALANFCVRMTCLDPFLFLSPSTFWSSARFRMRSWSARPNSVIRRRLPVSAFTFFTAPIHLLDPFESREA